MSLELTIKNMPKIESNIIIGYSNLANFISKIKFFDELSTNKLETSIKILKKLEKASRVKLSKNIFSTLFELFKIMAMVNKIINELRLKIKLKLFLINTPIIKIENIDKVKKISGNNIFKLFIISLNYLILNLPRNYLLNCLPKRLEFPLKDLDKNQIK